MSELHVNMNFSVSEQEARALRDLASERNTELNEKLREDISEAAGRLSVMQDSEVQKSEDRFEGQDSDDTGAEE